MLYPPPKSDFALQPSESEKKAEAAAPSSPSGSAWTAEEVAKHNKREDIWVIVDGQVLDATKFLPDQPGREKATLLYVGCDATEEFNMLHDPKVRSSLCPHDDIGAQASGHYQVIPRYAPESVIGSVKK